MALAARAALIATPAAGFVAGLLSGLLGVGGGIVMVPLLVWLVALTQHHAHVTSLAAIVPIAAAGAFVFGLRGEIDYQVAAALALGALVGAPLGAAVMARMDEAVLKITFGILLIVVALQLRWS